jgi:hypothetical protein
MSKAAVSGHHAAGSRSLAAPELQESKILLFLLSVTTLKYIEKR